MENLRCFAWRKRDIDHNENGDRAVLVDIKDLDYKASARKISAALFDEGILKEEHITEDWSELARDLKKRLKDTDGFHSLFSAVAG